MCCTNILIADVTFQTKIYPASTPTSPHIKDKRLFKETELNRNSLESEYVGYYVDRKLERSLSKSSKTTSGRLSSSSVIIFPLVSEVSNFSLILHER